MAPSISVPPPTAASLTESGFDRIVGNFYAAATGGVDWREALIPVQQTFGARAAVLHTMDMVDGRVLALESAGPQMNVPTLEYVSAWEREDPRKQRVLKLGPAALGQWLHCSDAFDDRFVERNRFFRHFLSGHEIRYNSHVTVPLDERTMTAFVLELPPHRGPLDDDERELARRFGVHMEQALLAHERVRRIAAQALAGHRLLSAFAYPMWLLDTERHVLFANEAATREEQAQTRTRRQAGRLRLASVAADQRLSAVLHELSSAAHGSQHHLRLGSESTGPAWIHLTVLVPSDAMGAFGQRRCVLATLFDPAHLSALDPFALSQVFGMTPAEARVAALLGEGLEPAAIAERLQVRITTVRTHVSKVLAAMGQSRVASAVRVLRQGEALWSAALAGEPKR